MCLTSGSGQLNNVPSYWFSLLSFFEIEQPETLVALQFNSVQLLSGVRFFASPWTAARQSSLFATNSQSLLKLMSIESVMPSNHLILCRPLLLLPSIFSSIRVFSNEPKLSKAFISQVITIGLQKSLPPCGIPCNSNGKSFACESLFIGSRLLGYKLFTARTHCGAHSGASA